MIIQMLKRTLRFSYVRVIAVVLAALVAFTIEGWLVSEYTMLTVYGKERVIFEDGEALKMGQELAGAAVVRDVFARNEARKERREKIKREKEAILSIEEGKHGEEEGTVKKVSSVIGYSQNDYEVLKRIVEAEAGICDIKGRILVANVIINRVRSEEFPNTVTDVVYQKSQFSPVSNGSLDSCMVTSETTEAVNRALAGEDYSQGALYFMNREYSQNGNVSWFDQSLTYLFQHDRHEFFK